MHHWSQLSLPEKLHDSKQPGKFRQGKKTNETDDLEVLALMAMCYVILSNECFKVSYSTAAGKYIWNYKNVKTANFSIVLFRWIMGTLFIYATLKITYKYMVNTFLATVDSILVINKWI